MLKRVRLTSVKWKFKNSKKVTFIDIHLLARNKTSNIFPTNLLPQSEIENVFKKYGSKTQLK